MQINYKISFWLQLRSENEWKQIVLILKQIKRCAFGSNSKRIVRVISIAFAPQPIVHIDRWRNASDEFLDKPVQLIWEFESLILIRQFESFNCCSSIWIIDEFG